MLFCVSETYIMIMTPINAVYLYQQILLFGNIYINVPFKQETTVGPPLNDGSLLKMFKAYLKRKSGHVIPPFVQVVLF